MLSPRAQFHPGQQLQPRGVRPPMGVAGRGHAAVVVQVYPPIRIGGASIVELADPSGRESIDFARGRVRFVVDERGFPERLVVPVGYQIAPVRERDEAVRQKAAAKRIDRSCHV